MCMDGLIGLPKYVGEVRTRSSCYTLRNLLVTKQGKQAKKSKTSKSRSFQKSTSDN